MRRPRVQLQRIQCEEKRRECYRKRKEGLKKKIYELSTLCDVKAFLVCYGPTGEVVAWPPDKRALRELVERYQSLAAEAKSKHNLNMSSYLLSEIEKQQKRLGKVAAADDRVDPRNCRRLENMTEFELRELVRSADETLERTRQRMAYLYSKKSLRECLESGHPETVPCFAYPTLSAGEDDNFAATTTTMGTAYLNHPEIPLNGYFHGEEPCVEANFNNSNIFFPLDYNIDTPPLASTSTSLFQEENYMTTFEASTMPIDTSVLDYYG